MDNSPGGRTKVKITLSEKIELIHHLEDRDDIWINMEGTWVRQRGESACLALAFIPMDDLFKVDITPMDWEGSDCEEYLEKLLNHWTDYRGRKEQEKLFQQVLGLDEETSHQLALQCSAIQSGDNLDPEQHALPVVQDRLFPDTLPESIPPIPTNHIGTFQIAGGGYVRLSLNGGQLRVEMSVRAAHGGGFTSTLTGFVRPRTGDTRTTAALIGGWPISDHVHGPDCPCEVLGKGVQARIPAEGE
jgi:hypothetical protein